MTKEEQKQETQVETKVSQETQPENKKITIDVDGIPIEVDVDTGKKLVEKRQANKKEVAQLKEAIAKAESTAKEAASKAALLEAMKASDVESVKAQVSQEYIEKIQMYEKKIFDSEIKATLAGLGVVDAALDDSVKLAKSDVKVELKDGNVLIAEKPAKEFLGEWIKTKPHLVAVKQVDVKKSPLVGHGAKVTTRKEGNLEKAVSKLL